MPAAIPISWRNKALLHLKPSAIAYKSEKHYMIVYTAKFINLLQR